MVVNISHNILSRELNGNVEIPADTLQRPTIEKQTSPSGCFGSHVISPMSCLLDETGSVVVSKHLLAMSSFAEQTI